MYSKVNKGKEMSVTLKFKNMLFLQKIFLEKMLHAALANSATSAAFPRSATKQNHFCLFFCFLV